MSAISNNDIARAIYLSSKGKSTDPSSFSSKVVQFLVRKRLLTKWKEILSHLEKVANEEEGRVVVKVSSRESLTAEVKNELSRFITRRYGGKEVVIVSKLDEKLIGGFKIEVGDEIIDLTIKNKIKKLQDYLIS